MTDHRRDRLRVLLAPDSFKGSLSSVEVARALAEGWARARPGDELTMAPLADGGEGTLAAIAEAGGWEWQECPAHDSLGRPLTARWLLSADGKRAAVELAEASGLSRLPEGEPRSPLAATTEGTGEVLLAVLDVGVRHVLLGLGGSATTDGGSGLLHALGVCVPRLRRRPAAGAGSGSGGCRPVRAGPAAGRAGDADRLRRDESTSRRARRGRDICPAEGSVAGGRRGASRRG